MYIFWEEIEDVLHGLRGDRGLTPLITKLAGVFSVKVPKSKLRLHNVDNGSVLI